MFIKNNFDNFVEKVLNNPNAVNFRWKAIWNTSVTTNARTYTYVIFYNVHLTISYLTNSIIAYKLFLLKNSF